ncbi:uncharacterized protein TNCV_3927181 [Trichonephila clavipes]|nr:uncharacterized protein TNCV_3927181 [Trichonephila clavipes]
MGSLLMTILIGFIGFGLSEKNSKSLSSSRKFRPEEWLSSRGYHCVGKVDKFSAAIDNYVKGFDFQRKPFSLFAAVGNIWWIGFHLCHQDENRMQDGAQKNTSALVEIIASSSKTTREVSFHEANVITTALRNRSRSRFFRICGNLFGHLGVFLENINSRLFPINSKNSRSLQLDERRQASRPSFEAWIFTSRKVFSEESEWKSESSYWLLKSEDNGSGKMAAHVGGECEWCSDGYPVVAKIYEVEKETAGWFARRSPSLTLTAPGVAAVSLAQVFEITTRNRLVSLTATLHGILDVLEDVPGSFEVDEAERKASLTRILLEVVIYDPFPEVVGSSNEELPTC